MKSASKLGKRQITITVVFISLQKVEFSEHGGGNQLSAGTAPLGNTVLVPITITSIKANECCMHLPIKQDKLSCRYFFSLIEEGVTTGLSVYAIKLQIDSRREA